MLINVLQKLTQFLSKNPISSPSINRNKPTQHSTTKMILLKYVCVNANHNKVTIPSFPEKLGHKFQWFKIIALSKYAFKLLKQSPGSGSQDISYFAHFEIHSAKSRKPISRLFHS